MIYIAILFAGASLGLSLLLIVWGICWATRPHLKVHRPSVIPTVPEPYTDKATVVQFRRSGPRVYLENV
jgi:hypothetical protein